MMLWDSIVGTLLKSVAPEVAGYYREKQKLKQEVEMEIIRGKAAYEAAKTKRAEASEGRDHEWELESIRNSGWKDEWVMGLVSIPAIMAFTPWGQPYVVAGFEALEATPLWYQTVMVSVFLAAYGIRWWRRKVD